MRKAFLHLVLTLACGCIFFATAIGAPHDLDLSFGNGGIVSTHIYSIGHHEEPSSILVQPDGKVLVAGQIDDYGYLVSFFIARYDPSGALDPSFGWNGMIMPPIDYNTGEYVGADIALQPDGKIIAIGYQAKVGPVVHRYNSNGTLDPSFGEGGVAVTEQGAAGRRIALQTDGKIVFVGNRWNGNAIDLAVVRLNPDGSLDNTFGAGGILITTFGGSSDVNEVLAQPDGKIVVVGRSIDNGGNSAFAVSRYNTDGSVDNSFGAAGKTITSVAPYNDYANAGVLQPDGKIVVAGSGYTNPPGSGGVITTFVRYNANGSIDTSFASNGIFTAELFSFVDYVSDIALQPDGKIVAFGSAPIPGNPNGSGFAVGRLNPNGSLEASFGTNGRVVKPIGGNQYSFLMAGAIQSDGKIIAVGNAAGYDPYVIGIVRYRGDSNFAADVSISGRVTLVNGRGLTNATVSITDPSGVRRTATTSTFGYYSFNNIPGNTYTMAVRSKRYQFQPRGVSADVSLEGVDFEQLK